MDKPEQRFTVNTRVKLRAGVDPSLYDGFSRVGNEGWIRKRKRDRYGYPQVLIEWDKDHWAYNGQQDGWTWEGQFEAVEENEMAEPEQNQNELDEKVRGITEQFVTSLFSALRTDVSDKPEIAESPAADADVEQDSDEPEGDRWEDLLEQAAEVVADAPAYLIIALERVEAEGAPPMIIPRLFHAARKPEYALIVQSHLAHVVASFQDATIAAMLEQAGKEDE